MIAIIPATVPACYGIACPYRATCRRYAAVETAHPGRAIATCATSADGAGGWPLRCEPAPAEAPAH